MVTFELFGKRAAEAIEGTRTEKANAKHSFTMVVVVMRVEMDETGSG